MLENISSECQTDAFILKRDNSWETKAIQCNLSMSISSCRHAQCLALEAIMILLLGMKS